ncbi:hypothetical protein [Ralstonia pseudosolanacearum]|uniref:hypothetical protein n=1 Tax=Ralstonia pseudosolanacearum TaxID=1310165 RepID=UPI002675656D|nr:hypothetical protein [Ralstonia pseudosolanacearum]MDO3518142.1 hypothetical protein [Ralstonia pseudosolanacearum]MDO3540661.1 hypothetical protein [Ralstonia pseudosolanacearum]
MAKFSSENPGLRFPEGRSANPVGRPRTVDRLRKDVARELVQHGATLTRLAVQRAIAGDAACLAACVTLIGTTVVEPKRKSPADGEGND